MGEPEESSFSHLASQATSKWLEFISYHFTLMSAQFDHSPILWGKQKESLFAF